MLQSYMGPLNDIQTALKPLKKNLIQFLYIFMTFLGLAETFTTMNRLDPAWPDHNAFWRLISHNKNNGTIKIIYTQWSILTKKKINSSNFMNFGFQNSIFYRTKKNISSINILFISELFFVNDRNNLVNEDLSNDCVKISRPYLQYFFEK